jgi:hypothetical protein
MISRQRYGKQGNKKIFSEKRSFGIAQIKILCTFALSNRPDGGIGRRAGLKHQWIHFHAGSIPALGTKTPS